MEVTQERQVATMTYLEVSTQDDLKEEDGPSDGGSTGSSEGLRFLVVLSFSCWWDVSVQNVPGWVRRQAWSPNERYGLFGSA